MPKKTLVNQAVALVVQDHLKLWGQHIRAQRIQARITAADLALRLGVSQPTITRLEKGDPGVNVSAYLSALYALGLRDQLAPLPSLINSNLGEKKRVRFSQTEKGGDLGYF